MAMTCEPCRYCGAMPATRSVGYGFPAALCVECWDRFEGPEALARQAAWRAANPRRRVAQAGNRRRA